MADLSSTNSQPDESTTANSAPFPPAPLLALKTCTIRPYHPADIPSAAHHANNPAIAKWMTNVFPSPYTLADAERWISSQLPPEPSTTTISTTDAPANDNIIAWPTPLHYAIAAPDANNKSTCIGGIGLKPGVDVHARSAELGYWLGEAYWGRGIASEAAAAFVDWAFGAMPALERLSAGVYAGNEASARVLVKAGFVVEGRLRRAVWKGGVWRDLVVLGALRGEYLQVRGDGKKGE